MTTNSLLTSIAVAGLGDIGLAVVQALASATPRPRILVLSRSSSKLPPLPAGVQTATIDYNDVPGVKAVLEQYGVQAVIATVGTTSIDVQYRLADAAKQAGVELFAPSEYGAPTEGAKEGLFLQKAQIADYIKSIGLPTARFYTGAFIEWLSVVLGTHTGKANLAVEGAVTITFTAIEDIGGFVAHALTTLPLSRLRNSTFRLEGHRATLQEVAGVLKLPIERVEAVPNPSPEASAFLTHLQHGFETGVGSTRWDPTKGRELTPEEYEAEDAIKLWQGHTWKKIGEVPMK